MGVVVLALFANNIQGLEGSILLGISHGFVSPALFICVGGIIYSRFHTRIIIYFKGLVNRMPLFILLFFIFSLFNTAIPLSLNYIGEFLSLTGVFLQSPFASILGASGIILSASYTIFLYNRIAYGSYGPLVEIGAGNLTDICRREFHLLIPLLIATVIFGVSPNIILNDLHMSVTNELFDVLAISSIIFFSSNKNQTSTSIKNKFIILTTIFNKLLKLSNIYLMLIITVLFLYLFVYNGYDISSFSVLDFIK